VSKGDNLSLSAADEIERLGNWGRASLSELGKIYGFNVHTERQVATAIWERTESLQHLLDPSRALLVDCEKCQSPIPVASGWASGNAPPLAPEIR
jgi:hypothetical protein